MIQVESFVSRLAGHGVDFFAGVPDSLLKDLCAYLGDRFAPESHVIAANEGGAVALAAGHHLATGRCAAVYLQNSGIGNATNPLMSLVDPEVYAIPVLLIIGWRGEPGRRDEPQHVKQGAVTLPQLEAMTMPYRILPPDDGELAATIDGLMREIRERSGPGALVVREGTFAPYATQAAKPAATGLTREEALDGLLGRLDPSDLVVATTGKLSREVFELRERNGEGHGADFLTVGSMGHASQIALAIALDRPDRSVVCLDGDGAMIMHMGALAIIGHSSPANLIHVVVNNHAHDSVGGQPTAARAIDIPALARASGYREAARASTADEAAEAFDRLRRRRGPVLLEVRVDPGARKDLGRPTSTPIENKRAFMAAIGAAPQARVR